MSFRPLLTSLFVLPVLLSGCGPGRNEFAPVCPKAELVPELADVTRYAGGGTSHDLTDLIVQGRVVSIQGSCKAGSDKDILAATVQIGITLQRGPAMRGREADIPVFLAVTDSGAVRDKQIFPLHVVFPPNVDRLTMSSPDIDLALPVTRNKTGTAYGIIAGFQLSQSELAANRQARGAR